MDTREKDAQWIDYSRPGEKPIYGKADMTVAQLEAIRQSRLNKENLAKLENSDFDEENLDNTIPASEKDSEKNENENQNQDALKAAIVKTDIQEQLEKQINENIKNGTDSIKSLSEQPVPAPIEQS
jgi:hypothetical protein